MWEDDVEFDEDFSFSEPQLQTHPPLNNCLATEELFSFSVVQAPCTDGGIVYHFSKTTGIVYLFSKKLALGDDLQSQAAQFAKLAAFIRAVHAADVNATAVLTTHDVRGVQ